MAKPGREGGSRACATSGLAAPSWLLLQLLLTSTRKTMATISQEQKLLLSSSSSWWKMGARRAPGSSLITLAGIRRPHQPRAGRTQLWLGSPLASAPGATGSGAGAALSLRTGNPLPPRGRSSHLATTCTPWRWVTALRSASQPPCS